MAYWGGGESHETCLCPVGAWVSPGASAALEEYAERRAITLLSRRVERAPGPVEHAHAVGARLLARLGGCAGGGVTVGLSARLCERLGVAGSRM